MGSIDTDASGNKCEIELMSFVKRQEFRHVALDMSLRFVYAFVTKMVNIARAMGAIFESIYNNPLMNNFGATNGEVLENRPDFQTTRDLWLAAWQARACA
jgi:hypothetical protein